MSPPAPPENPTAIEAGAEPAVDGSLARGAAFGVHPSPVSSEGVNALRGFPTAAGRVGYAVCTENAMESLEWMYH